MRSTSLDYLNRLLCRGLAPIPKKDQSTISPFQKLRSDQLDPSCILEYVWQDLSLLATLSYIEHLRDSPVLEIQSIPGSLLLFIPLSMRLSVHLHVKMPCSDLHDACLWQTRVFGVQKFMSKTHIGYRNMQWTTQLWIVINDKLSYLWMRKALLGLMEAK